MKELPDFLDNCTELIGHNILTFDIIALQKILGWKPKPHQRLVDTLIYSQVLNYKRFGFGHSLARWGEFLKHPKPEHEDWSQYSEEMKVRCCEDVDLNVKVFRYLVKELGKRKNKSALVIGIRGEHAVSRFVGLANFYGWPFDIEKAKTLLKRMDDRIEEIAGIIEPQLTIKINNVDPKDEFKSPAYRQNGEYAARTYSWFEIKPESGNREELWERPVWGDYCRVSVVKPEIGSLDSIRNLLYQHGWEPEEWNFTKDDRGYNVVRTTPKLDEHSLSKVKPYGPLITEFLTTRARASILRGWITENYDEETGRIYGDCFVIGTPTFRSRHIGIANIPSEDALYGPEIRSLFTTIPGYKVIGADSSGNQNRGLCHYLDDEEYTRSVTEGDIHEVNRKLLEDRIGSLGEDGRSKAKRFLYALLFGGGKGKLGLILTGKRDAAAGEKVRDGFLAAIPGLSRLVKRLQSQYDESSRKGKRAYIIGLDSRFVYVESDHKALNYLLQSAEKITVSLAVEYFMEKAEKEGIEWYPLIFMHDEIQILVRDDHVEKAAEIAAEAFKEGPKKLGVVCMDGKAKIGNNWAETH